MLLHFFVVAYCLFSLTRMVSIIFSSSCKHETIIIGTLPPELSYMSDSLVELNFAGGSLAGVIPTSYEKLTNLETLMLNDHCLSGTIPNKLSQLPKLNMLALGGNYELTGSLQEFCNEAQYKEQYFFLTANCDNNVCNTVLVGGKDYYEPNVECECCVCCNPDTFECCSPLGDTWSSYYKGVVLSSTDIPKSFDRPCLSKKSYDWLEDECPCFEDIITNDDIIEKECTKDCTKVGTVPSYDPQAQQ
jgi:hypothetical protein